MIKIVTIIGARPQIIKAAAISRAIRNHFSNQINEIIVHTGQHYDENMSAVFFSELEIPKENYNLSIGSGNHGWQTARMIEGIEEIILKEKPQYLIIYGDTNSTLAGAIAASKLGVKIVHIEAGLRSFNRSMPEETNRILADHTSSMLFSPTKTGFNNLLKEGFSSSNKSPYTSENPGIFHCGDIMYDNSIYFSTLASKKSTILKELGLENKKFALATIHRNTNTDNAENLYSIFKSFISIAEKNMLPIVVPLHPRTKKIAESIKDEKFQNLFTGNSNIIITPPLSFFDIMVLEMNTEIVFTDSGGVQKEAYFFKKPCIILRNETEWIEIVENKCAILCGSDSHKIENAFNKFREEKDLKYPTLFGDGKAAEFICNQINNNS
ncbi:MAG: UDP-N-acetylglucosamine 2-epimerase (non-hydrolyzing) [Bacteroidales bacterium]|jgi:UDP-GlcNAc3NAcA epimerase|nr:UDP-N-acetylglucosamine 2-epimerase (non-hydrolyzing) [Bacteroidales bacterium]